MGDGLCWCVVLKAVIKPIVDILIVAFSIYSHLTMPAMSPSTSLKVPQKVAIGWAKSQCTYPFLFICIFLKNYCSQGVAPTFYWTSKVNSNFCGVHCTHSHYSKYLCWKYIAMWHICDFQWWHQEQSSMWWLQFKVHRVIHAHFPPQNRSSPMFQDPMDKSHINLKTCLWQFHNQHQVTCTQHQLFISLGS